MYSDVRTCWLVSTRKWNKNCCTIKRTCSSSEQVQVSLVDQSQANSMMPHPHSRWLRNRGPCYGHQPFSNPLILVVLCDLNMFLFQTGIPKTCSSWRVDARLRSVETRSHYKAMFSTCPCLGSSSFERDRIELDRTLVRHTHVYWVFCFVCTCDC